ncbi:MAG: KamA family radical SAM protein [Kiritimatiellaeota bacterium]|nr:KamA family radical SAM protein [Kiritimatiellota bacterium]
MMVKSSSEHLFRAADWHWQLRHRIRSVVELVVQFPCLRKDAAGIAAATERFPLAITPYYAGLIRHANDSDPIFRLAVPQAVEIAEKNPMGEGSHTPVPGLIRRYRDRALILVASTCATYCRHCDRKRVAGQREGALTLAQFRRVVAWIARHKEIHDVILSGGDPLTLDDDELRKILSALRAIPHVELIRIHTRTPVTLPQRITPDLVKMLRRFQPLWLNTQFNHPRELTPQACTALARLADAGIPLGNQSVLLRGVNDSVAALEQLFRGLVRNRVRPYYLFQCELVRGVEHFRVPIRRGLAIMAQLRRRLSNLALPTYVLDTPAAGKIPLTPGTILAADARRVKLRGLHGQHAVYPEPR